MAQNGPKMQQNFQKNGTHYLGSMFRVKFFKEVEKNSKRALLHPFQYDLDLCGLDNLLKFGLGSFSKSQISTTFGSIFLVVERKLVKGLESHAQKKRMNHKTQTTKNATFPAVCHSTFHSIQHLKYPKN